MPSHTVAPEKAVIGDPVSGEEQAAQLRRLFLLEELFAGLSRLSAAFPDLSPQTRVGFVAESLACTLPGPVALGVLEGHGCDALLEAAQVEMLPRACQDEFDIRKEGGLVRGGSEEVGDGVFRQAVSSWTTGEVVPGHGPRLVSGLHAFVVEIQGKDSTNRACICLLYTSDAADE